MNQTRGDGELGAFFVWMDELNQEAERRGYEDWPLPLDIAHSPNCWMIDFLAGRSPAEALDANQ